MTDTLWQPWRCATHTFFQERACFKECGQLTASSYSIFGISLSFPTMAILFRSRTFLASTERFLPAVFALEPPVGLAHFLPFPLSQGSEPHSLEAFSASFWSHFPWFIIGIILNTSTSNFVLEFDSWKNKSMQAYAFLSLCHVNLWWRKVEAHFT